MSANFLPQSEVLDGLWESVGGCNEIVTCLGDEEHSIDKPAKNKKKSHRNGNKETTTIRDGRQEEPRESHQQSSHGAAFVGSLPKTHESTTFSGKS